jgi:hypothetical protein
MRLTLRTMLAYMDGVLPPADAEELRRKIEQNEGASGIMHRVRDVMCRMRLGAPKVEGRGLGGDANTVAEYLDNTLAAEKVPEFERVCLESDAHLAEAAACHHILALVLGERAEVDPDMRRRLYGLIDAPEKPSADAAPPVAAPPVAEPQGVAELPKTRRKRGVPEYLRDDAPRAGWLKWAVAVAALLVLGAIGAVAAVGPNELLSRLGLATTPTQVAQNNDTGEAATTDEEAAPEVAADDEPVDEESETATEDQAPFDLDEVKEPVVDDDATALDEYDSADAARSIPALDPVTDDEDVAMEEETGPAPPTPDESTTEETPVDEEMLTETEVPAEPSSDSTEPGVEETEPAVVADTPAPPAANEMGKAFLEKDVLLRYAPNEETWKRLAQGDAVAAGDRLLSFPHFSPAVTLSNGVAVRLMGATQVMLESPDVDGTPGVRVLFGHVVLMPISDPQSPVRLLIGADEYLVTFPDTKPTLFIEVRPELVNGADPEKTPAHLNVDFYLGAGNVTWQKGTAPAAELTAPLRWTTDPATPAEINEAPAWIQEEKRMVAEAFAAPTIEQSVKADRPVQVSLKEAAVHRRRELRSLATKCLALIGEYDDFVAVLNDASQYPAWDGQIEALRAGMARSPEDAAKVRIALEKSRSGDAKGLYRLLWGYDEDQFLTGGASQDLLADLEHPHLDYRVLAYWNLRQLTGARHPYDPRDEDGKPRKDRVELWQKKVTQLLKEKAPG